MAEIADVAVALEYKYVGCQLEDLGVGGEFELHR
jgi:hypothetical protein